MSGGLIIMTFLMWSEAVAALTGPTPNLHIASHCEINNSVQSVFCVIQYEYCFTLDVSSKCYEREVRCERAYHKQNSESCVEKDERNKGRYVSKFIKDVRVDRGDTRKTYAEQIGDVLKRGKLKVDIASDKHV